MKILFYISTISGGGAARVMTNLANRFADDGNECLLITSFKDEKEYYYSEKVDKRHLFEKPFGGFLKKNFKLVKELRKVVKSEKPDIVVSFLPEPNFRNLLATKGLKVKTLVSVRNDPNREYSNKLFRILAKTLYKKADGIVFQTQDAKSWFSNKIQAKSRIIFNQVDQKFFDAVSESSLKNIVTFGRLNTQKNQKMLIDAFSMIADKYDDNLIIYGDGDLREELQAFIDEKGLTDRVFLPGATKDVENELKKAKVFVLSSDFEGMPNALMEAMAEGLACISTDCPCGGPKALINQDENGILVPVNDANAMAEALGKVLSMTDEERKAMGERAKNSAQQFKPDVIYQEWKDYLSKIVGCNKQ